MKKDTSISIINYKTKELTEKCLKSIFEKQLDANFDVWVVDNGSADGSADYLKERFPKINLIRNDKNVGFGKGHNLVLKKINTKYALLLNSDTEVNEKVIDQMVEFMEKNEEVGIASCKILGFDNKLQPNGGHFPFGLALFVWLLNLESLNKNFPNFHREDTDYYDSIHEVDWISGNFMMARVEVLKEVNFFNEKYFMYFEDVDLCFKVKRAGFKIMINPSMSIRHLSGGSTDNPKLRQWVGEYRGLIIFYKELYGGLSGFLVRLLLYFTTVLRILVFALIGKFNYSLTYVNVIKYF